MLKCAKEGKCTRQNNLYFYLRIVPIYEYEVVLNIPMYCT